MRWQFFALPLMLAGCGQREAERNEAAAAQPAAPEVRRDLTDAMLKNGFDPHENLAVTDDSEAQVGTLAGNLPPAGRKLRFMGNWASELANCTARAWHFTGASLDTPAGSHCEFRNVRQVPGGYDIAATCTAEAPPAEDRITLRFAESAKAMLFESDAIADAGLVYCGD